MHESVPGKQTNTAEKTIKYTRGNILNQRTSDIINWYNLQYSTSSRSLRGFNLIKAKYLQHILAQENQIFLKAHTSAIKSVLITNNNQYIISSSHDKTIIIWDFPSQKQEAVLKGHTSTVSCIAATSDSKYLVSGSWDRTIQIWILQDKVQESILEGHTISVELIKIASNDLYIVSSSRDGTVIIWNFQNKTQEATLFNQNHYFYAENLAISRSSNSNLPYHSIPDPIIWDFTQQIQKMLLKII